MWKLTFLILLFYELPIFCFGQQVYKLADTILVNQMLQEADTLSKQKKFSAAIAKQERARLILEQIFTKTSKQVIAVMAQIGANYFYMGEPDKAINNYEKILTLKTALAETDTSDWNLQEIYFSLGFAYARQGAYDTSMENYEKALAIATKKWGATDKKTLYYWQEQGINYAATGRYEQAGKYFQKALDIAINSFKYQPAIASRIYGNLAIVYDEMHEYDKAMLYYQKSLINESNKINLGNTAGNMGASYHDVGNYEMALLYTQRAIDMLTEGLGAEHPRTLMYIGNIANTYHKLGDEAKAFQYQQQALDGRLKKLGSNHPDLGLSYRSMADYHAKKKQYDKSLEYYQKAFTLYSRPRKKISAMVGMIDAYVAFKKYSETDSLFQLAHQVLNCQLDENPAKATSLYGLAKIASAKGLVRYHQYLDSRDLKFLIESIQFHKKTLELAQYEKNTMTTQAGKMEIQNNLLEVYNDIFTTSLLWTQLTQNDSLKKTLFDYQEQSKANLLQAQLKESEALQYAGIPTQLLNKEYNLRRDLTWQNARKQGLLSQQKMETDSIVLMVSSKIFDLKQSYDSLKLHFEKNYPAYYRLKYDYSTIALGDLQQKLSPEQTLLSYFVGDSSVYAFVVQHDRFEIFDLKKDFPLETLVKQLRTGLYGYYTAPKKSKTDSLYIATADSFAIAAHQLYQKLLLPFQTRLKKELIIVPDGVLNYISFEALLTELPETATEFKFHSYFGKKHVISYNYSATLWQEMATKKHHVEPQKKFIGFAPYFNGDTTLLSERFSHDLTLRKGLDSLKYSGEEVFKATKLMHGDAVLDKAATKAVFEKTVGDYRIVHLATHGKANDKVGDYSFLAFTELKDSVDNELLYVRDIYNLRLNADLVVLSACETGIGELRRGEGVVSLARAFAYSGAKSLITTLWNVDDRSTMLIMTDFYKNLKKGRPKDLSLWQAKQAYLEESRNKTAHPYFWSAFIPIGDMKAIKN